MFEEKFMLQLRRSGLDCNKIMSILYKTLNTIDPDGQIVILNQEEIKAIHKTLVEIQELKGI
jgi:hypothetical protein